MGLLENTVVIWRSSSGARISAVSHKLPVVSWTRPRFISEEKKLVNLSSSDFLSRLHSLPPPPPRSLLSFICNKRPVALTSCKAPSISAPLSTSSLHPRSRPAFYCWILPLSPVRSDPCYLQLSAVSPPPPRSDALQN